MRNALIMSLSIACYLTAHSAASAVDHTSAAAAETSKPPAATSIESPLDLLRSSNGRVVVARLAAIEGDGRAQYRKLKFIVEQDLANARGPLGNVISITRGTWDDQTRDVGRKLSVRRHRDPAFWLGAVANGFQTDEHKTGFQMAVGSRYVIFADMLESRFSMERVEHDDDLWLQAVRRYFEGARLEDLAHQFNRSEVLRMFTVADRASCRRDGSVDIATEALRFLPRQIAGDLKNLCSMGKKEFDTYKFYFDNDNDYGLEILLAFPIVNDRRLDVDEMGGYNRQYSRLAE